MAVNRIVGLNPVSVAEAHLARVAEEGSGQHAHLAALLANSGPDAARNLADAVHLLCSLHGRHPGLIDIAAQRSTGPVRDWMVEAGSAFERERLYLLSLVSAVGPLPSTPGNAETEAGLAAQRNALEILGASERRGCALGASCALIGDWAAIRPVLDRAAARHGIEPGRPVLPDPDDVASILELASDTPAASRALAFGAEQLLLQHRGFFDLLEARAEARQGL